MEQFFDFYVHFYSTHNSMKSVKWVLERRIKQKFLFAQLEFENFLLCLFCLQTSSFIRFKKWFLRSLFVGKFRTLPFCTHILGLYLFWRKNIGAKDALKMLVKLAPFLPAKKMWRKVYVSYEYQGKAFFLLIIFVCKV